MKSLVLICLIVVGVYAPTKAQVSYGVKAGGELYHLWDPDFEISGPKLGFTGGIFVKFRFLRLFAIQPEILYLSKGGKTSENSMGKIFVSPGLPDTKEIPLTISRTATFQNVEFPLLFKLYAPGFITASPHLLIGPYYGYMAGEREIDVLIAGVNGTTPITREDFPDADNNGMNDYDDLLENNQGKGEDNLHEYGLVLGAGVDFSLGTFDIRYAIGLTDIESKSAPGRDLDKSHTGTLTVMFGFEF